MSEAPTFEFTVAGAAYTVRLGELTPKDAGDFRRAVGMSLMSAFGQVDLDVIAGFVWLVRRRMQPGLSYETVAESFTYDDYLADGPAEPAEADTDPPA